MTEISDKYIFNIFGYQNYLYNIWLSERFKQRKETKLFLIIFHPIFICSYAYMHVSTHATNLRNFIFIIYNQHTRIGRNLNLEFNMKDH